MAHSLRIRSWINTEIDHQMHAYSHEEKIIYFPALLFKLNLTSNDKIKFWKRKSFISGLIISNRYCKIHKDSLKSNYGYYNE